MADPILRDYIRNTMRDDETIRGLINKSSSPYGVYMGFPKKDIKPPLITFMFLPSTYEELESNLYFAVKAWGIEFENLLNRVYTLFHKTSPNTSDYHNLIIKFDGSSAELWDDGLQCYYRQDRYKIITIKE